MIFRIVMSNDRELFFDAPNSGAAYDAALRAHPGESVQHLSAVATTATTEETEETEEDTDD